MRVSGRNLGPTKPVYNVPRIVPGERVRQQLISLESAEGTARNRGARPPVGSYRIAEAVGATARGWTHDGHVTGGAGSPGRGVCSHSPTPLVISSLSSLLISLSRSPCPVSRTSSRPLSRACKPDARVRQQRAHRPAHRAAALGRSACQTSLHVASLSRREP